MRSALLALASALALASCRDSSHMLAPVRDAEADANAGSGGAGTGGSWDANAGGAGATSAGSGGVAGSSGSGSDSGGATSIGGASGTGGAGATFAGSGGVAGSSGGGSDSGGATSTGGAPGIGGAGGAQVTCPAAGCVNYVCERYGGPICRDGEWAEWPMPNSMVDVADGAPNPASYTDNGDGTVTDEVTRLQWQQVVPPALPSYNATIQYCADLVLGGYDDWRVPSRIELLSIVDYGRKNPSIDPVFGGDQPARYYVTATRADTSAWFVSFYDGGSLQTGFDTMNIVRCVR